MPSNQWDLNEEDVVDVTGEQDRAVAAEGVLQIALAAEVTRAEAAETKLTLVVLAKSANFAALANHIYPVDATGGAVNATLPTPTSGTYVLIKKVDVSSNHVTVLPHASETIETASSSVLSTQFAFHAYVADGTNWWIVG